MKKFKATTDSKHSLPVAPNRAHKDLCTGKIVGYALGARITSELVRQSLLKAVNVKRPDKGLIHHSDRGFQYCADAYQELLVRLGIKASMSRKGNCYDNAPMESFWGTMKNELVHHRRYATRAETINDITEYIEVFYNRERCQKRLGYLSPAAYDRKFYAEKAAA